MRILLVLALSTFAAQPIPKLAKTAVPVTAYGKMTGALYRSQPELGPIKTMWVVYKRAESAKLGELADPMAKIKEHNPGVEVRAVALEDLGDLKDKAALYEKLKADQAEFVLGVDQDVYEVFRGLRDKDLAKDIPMGWATRKSVSVDMPRASLDPVVLSDPKTYAARRYLWLGKDGAAKHGERIVAGMEEVRNSLGGALQEMKGSVHGHASEDMNFIERLGTKLMMKLAKQSDDKQTAKLRKKAHALAAYIEKEKIDVLATDDDETTQVLGLMKKMGYHKSLPVVWAAREKPAETSGVNMTVVPAPWMGQARHVELSPEANLTGSLKAAAKMERLPDNFMDQGGVSVKDFEPAVAQAVEKALPGKRAKGTYDVHFMLTNGNGVTEKGDANAFGHFGLAVTDEKGKAQVWTVQYNDGGSFTGGLGDLKQLSLGEYLYNLWYLPGAVGQAIPLAETAVAPVFDFILRGVDEAQLEAMRRKAAEINARHLKGLDNYRFLNQSGMTNCISMVTQILRAAGFRIPETSIQDPAGQAMNMFGELARWLLSGRIEPSRFGFVVFDRPAHAGPEHYRIPNTAVASPLFNRPKPWERMRWYEKLWRFVAFPYNLMKAMAVPGRLEGLSAMASHKVVVGPNSRELEVVENAGSPILRIRRSAESVARLRAKRAKVMERLSVVEDKIISILGYAGWQRNPGQARQKAPHLEADLDTHHRMTVELELNNIDELIELRRIELLTLQLADPTGKRLPKGLHADYETVLTYRDRVLIQDRVLSEQEKDELDVLNARLEARLEKARKQLLRDAGPSAAQSVKMILGQVSREDLETLQEKSESEAGQGGDAKKPK